MTDFALPGKCGGLGASGLTAACARGGKSEESAMAPNPWAARTSTSRRVSAGVKCGLRNIQKLVTVEQGQTEIVERASSAEELARQFHFVRARRTGQGQLPRSFDRALAILAARPLQARGEVVRNLLHETGVEQRQRLQR